MNLSTFSSLFKEHILCVLRLIYINLSLSCLYLIKESVNINIALNKLNELCKTKLTYYLFMKISGKTGSGSNFPDNQTTSGNSREKETLQLNSENPTGQRNNGSISISIKYHIR